MKSFLFSCFLCSCLVATESAAQAPGVLFPYERFENDFIPAEVHKARRKRITDSHSNKALIVVLSAETRNRQNDVDFEFRQSSTMIYLSGCYEPNTALILAPGGIEIQHSRTTEALFVPKRNQKSETWTGVKMGVEEAKQQCKVDQTLEYSSFVDVLLKALDGKDTLIIAGNVPTPIVTIPISNQKVFVEKTLREWIQEKYPNVIVKTSLPMLAAMREVKDEHEIRLMQKAIDISCEAHAATMKAAKPGMNEYELEAVMEFTFKRLGSEYPGYPSIVGSGYNSCILHYESNRKVTKQGDLILADCGAEYHGYTADITRTFPINGTFTKEQKILYNIVLEAQDSGIAACRAGNGFRSPHIAAQNVLRNRLMELGIIQKPEELSYYFMHGTSHYLGLDVHDLGTNGSLKSGTVITVEPGIYIAPNSPCESRWWNIGIRIEDDILVTTNEPVNLSKKLPRTAEEVETLMRD